MAGSPLKRARREAEEAARRERDKLNGDKTTTGEVGDMTRNDVQHAQAKVDDRLNKAGNRRGHSPERMAQLRAIRDEQAKTDPSKKGGRKPEPKNKDLREQAKQDKMNELLPKAYTVLEKQLDHRDARIAQMAAIKVIEWVKGKPSQTVKMDGEQVHTIRYETVAFTAHGVIELPTEDVIELGPGEGSEGE